MNANCDSILQSHVIDLLNFPEFENKLKKFKISLSFR
jgi:hypothetical protein